MHRFCIRFSCFIQIQIHVKRFDAFKLLYDNIPIDIKLSSQDSRENNTTTTLSQPRLKAASTSMPDDLDEKRCEFCDTVIIKRSAPLRRNCPSLIGEQSLLRHSRISSKGGALWQC